MATAETPSAATRTPLLVRASPLHGGKHAIRDGRAHLHANQAGEVLQRTDLAVIEFTKRHLPGFQEVRVAVEIRNNAALDKAQDRRGSGHLQTQPHS